MRKVQNPTVEGEVVGASNKFGNPKKPLDKRWLIIGGLILILVVVFVVLLVISNPPNNTTSGNSSNNTQPQGDPISADKITSAVWSCDDYSTITFDGNDVKWSSRASILEMPYKVDDSQLSFGTVIGTVEDNKLALTIADNYKVACTRSDV